MVPRRRERVFAFLGWLLDRTFSGGVMLVQSLPQSQPVRDEAAIPNLLPVVRELPADLETPVSVYLKLAGEGPSFLLESVSGGEQVARFSFIGVQSRAAFVLRPCGLEKHTSQCVGE